MAAAIAVGTNSFITEAESVTILEEFVHASTWSTALNRVPAIITAWNDIALCDLIDPDDSNNPIDPANAPADVKKAQALLAFEFSVRPASATASGQGGTNIKSVGAGSARVAFFRPEDKSRFPTLVSRLLSPYLAKNLASGTTIAGSYASDTSGASQFDDCDRASLTEGYR